MSKVNLKIYTTISLDSFLILLYILLDPLANVTVTGRNWLQQGDVLNLEVQCSGSPPFEYCYRTSTKPFNSTGNETCEVWHPIPTCQFRITRYFFEAKPYTILIVMRNQVTLINKEITVNIYNVKKQSQLSVIVVPVAFTLVAVILVIFGVAYYVQNKHQ